MRKLVASVLGLAVALSIVLHAQTKPSPSPSPAAKPDFNGTWVFQSGTTPSGSPSTGAWRLGMEFSVATDDKAMTISSVARRPGETKTVYMLDGTTTLNGTVPSKLEWDGKRLVLTMGPERIQVWTLNVETGILTVDTSTLPGGGLPPVVANATYRRK